MQNENLSTLCVCANGSLHTDLTLARANKSHILHNLYCRGIACACLISVVAIEEFFILYTPYSTVVANFLLTVFCYRKRFALFLKKTALPLRGFFGAEPLCGLFVYAGITTR